MGDHYRLIRSKIFFQDETRYDYWKRTEFSPEQWKRIIDHCKLKKIIVGASVFSIEALKIAKNLGLRGTPASVVNDTIFPGYIQLSKLEQIVSQ